VGDETVASALSLYFDALVNLSDARADLRSVPSAAKQQVVDDARVIVAGAMGAYQAALAAHRIA
jgi:hypothetical protein